MGRTLRAFICLSPKFSGYFYKCNRKQNKLVSRYSHRVHRKDNRYADELHFASFKDQKYKNSYQTSTKAGQLIGNKYRVDQFIEDSFRRDIASQTEVQKLSIKIRELLYRQTSENTKLKGKGHFSARHLSDLYIAAYKQLKRRGTIAPFRGHRNKSQLYKRELYLC